VHRPLYSTQKTRNFVRTRGEGVAVAPDVLGRSTSVRASGVINIVSSTHLLRCTTGVCPGPDIISTVHRRPVFSDRESWSSLPSLCGRYADLRLLSSACDTGTHGDYVSVHRWVTGQFRCATLELCNFDAKQSNMCCFDGFCTNLCCTKADVILTGPQEQNRGLWVGTSLKQRNTRNTTRKTPKMIVVPPGEWNVNRISPLMR